MLLLLLCHFVCSCLWIVLFRVLVNSTRLGWMGIGRLAFYFCRLHINHQSETNGNDEYNIMERVRVKELLRSETEELTITKKIELNDLI